MKELLIIQFFCFFLACSNSKTGQENNNAAFSMQDFVAIIRDNNFEKFIVLVNKPDYELDSSLNDENRIIYSAGDTTTDDGDYISVHMTKNGHILFLNFTTSDKSLYLQLKSQIGEMGFKAIDDKSALKEFMLGGIHLSLMILDELPPVTYSFSFVRDD